MSLRETCVHGAYEAHPWAMSPTLVECPGGRILTDQALMDLLPVVELQVVWLNEYDRYGLVLPENYPQGPKWLDTDEPIKVGDFVGVIPIPLGVS